MAKSAASVKFDTGTAVPMLLGTGNRANIAATGTGTAATATGLPTGAAITSDNTPLVIIRATDYMWFRFGMGAVAATADANSILLPPGEGIYAIPAGATHFSVLEYTAAATPRCQVESCG